MSTVSVLPPVILSFSQNKYKATTFTVGGRRNKMGIREKLLNQLYWLIQTTANLLAQNFEVKDLSFT